MNQEYLLSLIYNSKEENEILSIIEYLRPKATHIKSSAMMNLIDKAIEKSSVFNNKKIMIFLYDLKIRQLYHLNKNLEKVCFLLTKMKNLVENSKNYDCIALFNQLVWHIEKLKGNHKKSLKGINTSMLLLRKSLLNDKYTINFCRYSYAVEIWLTEHNLESANLLEECIDFFYQNNYYRSLAQIFGLLSIIYTRKHESKRTLSLSNQILANRDLFENLPLDVKGIIYYFTGLGYMLDANLVIAESYFNEAYTILKPIYKDSIYFAYYLVLLSYLAKVKGLQCKTEQATNMVKEADKLLQTEFVKKNLDENSKKQIIHTHNLTKFYNISRLSNYNPQENQELMEEIYEGCKVHYSDFMTFSEFILNSNFDFDKLQQLLTIDNFSINRVKHLIEFMLEKQKLEAEISQEQKSLNCITILEKRVITSKTTFIEHVYANLLIAQQLFSLKRYAEISPLLKQYESRLKRIEVLEMRIFMEAFIQVGAYKNGDPLGPALQYMAIKKCRDYGFSRLEKILLDYLQLQRKEIPSRIYKIN